MSKEYSDQRLLVQLGTSALIFAKVPAVLLRLVLVRVRRGLTSSAFVGMTFTGKPEWEYDSPGSGGLTPAFTLDRLGSFVNAGLCLSY